MVAVTAVCFCVHCSCRISGGQVSVNPGIYFTFNLEFHFPFDAGQV